MMSALTASGRWYGTPLDLDLICSLSEEPHLVRVFHLLLRMTGGAPVDDDDYDGYAYRARPVVPGGVVFTLALRLGRTGRDLIAPWLLGWVVETIWVVSSQPER